MCNPEASRSLALDSLQVLKSPTTAGITAALDTAIQLGRPAFVLFDPEMEGVHNALIGELTRTDNANVHVVLWRGEETDTQESFFAECGRAIPGAASCCFGTGHGNLNSLRDHLHEDAILLRKGGEGPVQDRHRRILWVCRNVNKLFRTDPEFFRKLFASIVQDAAELTSGQGLGGIGDFKFGAQPVQLVLTGSWPAFEQEVRNPQSFLHVTLWWQFEPKPPPDPTNLVVLRITT